MRFLLFYLTAFTLVLASAGAQAQPAAGRASTLPSTRTGGFMSFHRQYVERVKQGDIDVIFSGDSITFQWRNVGKAVWDKYYGAMKAVNFGHNGDGTQHLLWRLQNGECDGPAPKVVVLMIGTNNMGGTTFSVTDV